MLFNRQYLRDAITVFVSYCIHENLTRYFYSLAKQQKSLPSELEISEYILRQFCSEDFASQLQDNYTPYGYLCLADLEKCIKEFRTQYSDYDINPISACYDFAKANAEESILETVKDFFKEYVKEVDSETYQNLLHQQSLGKFSAKDIFTSDELRQFIADSPGAFVRYDDKILCCYPEILQIRDNFLEKDELKLRNIGMGVKDRILYLKFNFLNSTNKFLENISKQFPELCNCGLYILITTEVQTSGIGRKGSWISLPYGDVIMSIGFKQEDRSLLPITMANLVHNTLTKLVDPRYDSNQLKIKWPNDIYFYNAKISGSLISVNNDYVIYGLGINIAPRLILAEVPEMFNTVINSLYFENKNFSAEEFNQKFNPYSLKTKFILNFSKQIIETFDTQNLQENLSKTYSKPNKIINHLNYFRDHSLYENGDLVEVYDDQRNKLGQFSYQGITEQGYLELVNLTNNQVCSFINPITIRKIKI